MNLHYEYERKERRQFIAETIGFGNDIATVLHVSKTSNKERYNVLSDSGVVTVYEKSWKIVTVYIASYPQAIAIYRKCYGKEPSADLKNNFITAQRYKEIEP